MKDDWSVFRVGDLVAAGSLAISDGYRVTNEELGPVGIPFVRGGDIADGAINSETKDRIRPEFTHRVRRKLACPDDVAFITKGTVGRVGRVRSDQPPVVFAPQVAYWRVLDSEVLDPRFVFYLLQSRQFQDSLDAVKTHGSMVADYVSISQQHDFRLQLPPIHTQREIAALLGTFDNKLELNQRLRQTIECLVDALIGDILAKARDEPDSDWVRLGDVATFAKGASYRSADLAPSPNAMVSLKCFDKRGLFSAAGLKPYAGPIKDRHEVVAGEIVVAQTDLTQAADVLGRAIRVPASTGFARLVASLDCVVARPTSSRLSRALLLGVLRQPEFRWHAVGYANGTTVLHLGKQALPDYEFALPRDGADSSVTSFAESAFALADELLRESQMLEVIRAALLSHLVAGKSHPNSMDSASR